jgi:hypothetical protein
MAGVMDGGGGGRRADEVARAARRTLAAIRRGERTPDVEVEPAAFGAALERTLSPEERHLLGAHFTPRAFVERLVRPVLEDPLREAWAEAREAAAGCPAERAIAIVEAFHAHVASVRILDPASGTGNFLYVTLELLRRLEAEVIAALRDLGRDAPPRVGPAQLLGIEKSPAARRIARLVLRIADARSRLPGPKVAGEAHIARGDALRDPWPTADYVLGNPPFLGQQRLRAVLGDAYVDAIRRAHPDVPETCDLVMYWWHRAAELLRAGAIRRFGFITTSSIAQPQNRKVIARHLAGDRGAPMSIVLAIPDHPWIAPGGAAVRVAVTVVAPGEHDGALHTIVREDGERVELACAIGRIRPDLGLGADVAACAPLRAMRGVAVKGLELGGQGFLIERSVGDRWLADDPSLARVLRLYMNGADLMRGRARRYVIDFHGLGEAEARRFGPAFAQVEARVRAGRAASREARLRAAFWLFRRSGAELRAALAGLGRFIATARTARHRVFQLLGEGVAAESKIVVVASDDAYHLGVLSARPHRLFAERAGGWLGKGNDATYNHEACFDAFPFPDPTPSTEARIRALGEALDALRKQRLADHPGLTITAMYNALDALRAGARPAPRDQAAGAEGVALELRRLHDELDAAVIEAYGLPEGAGDEPILEALTALNAARAAEEARGIVRWLRSGSQKSRPM